MSALSHSHFLKAVQSRVARVSVSASATRQQGVGVVEPARAFLAAMPLRQFSTDSQSLFTKQLNNATNDLQAELPLISQSWGLARKLLNIFLRDSLYTSYLNDEYQLSKAETFMEVPLDSISASALLKAAPKLSLPKWPGVKHNTEDVSAKYQEFAASLVAKAGVARVHFDTYWWGARSDLVEA